MTISIDELKSDLSKARALYSTYTDKVKDFLTVHEQTLRVMDQPLTGLQLIELCSFYGVDSTTIKEIKMQRVMSPSKRNNDLLYWNLQTLYVPGAGATIDIFADAHTILSNLDAIIRCYTKLCFDELNKHQCEENVLKAMYLRRDINRLSKVLDSETFYNREDELIKWSEVTYEDNYIDTDYNYEFLEESTDLIAKNYSGNGQQRVMELKGTLLRMLFNMRVRFEFIGRIEQFKVLMLTN